MANSISSFLTRSKYGHFKNTLFLGSLLTRDFTSHDQIKKKPTQEMPAADKRKDIVDTSSYFRLPKML